MLEKFGVPHAKRRHNRINLNMDTHVRDLYIWKRKFLRTITIN